MRSQKRFKKIRQISRTGAVVAEFAISVPVLLATAMGAIEVCNVVNIQANIQSAAFEGARIATRPSTSNALAASSAQVITDTNNVLTQLGVKGATVQLSPSDLSTVIPQSLVVVYVSAPLNQNSVICYLLNSKMTVTASATMVVE